MRKTLLAVTASMIICAAGAEGADAEAGKAAYDKACKSCHGADGAPNAKIAAAMKVEMRHLGAKPVQALADAALKKIITDGTGKMKPTRTISGADVDNVVAYIRTLKQ